MIEPAIKKNLTALEIEGILQYILGKTKSDGKPEHGVYSQLATKYGVCDRTIRNVWAKARIQREQGDLPIVITNRKKTWATMPRKPFDSQKFKEIPLTKKKNFRSIAHELGIGKSTVHRWFKDGKIRAHTNAIKPRVTELNEYQRIKFALQHLTVDREHKTIKFKDMQHTIHIDEKWFLISNSGQRYYLSPDEVEPHRFVQNKRFLIKAMFLCVVTRPFYYSVTGQCLFDGKIGVYPFTQQVEAVRSSKNRDRGTIETKVVDVVNKRVIRDLIIHQVLSDIKSKWPAFLSKNIIIQQDNAKPHISDDEVEFRAAASSDGFNIHLMNQPANSPDCNVNDLGWFRALAAMQCQIASYSLDQLIQAVKDSFTTLGDSKLNCVFLSLQACMIEILKVKGTNNYKIPHLGKNALMRAGVLPKVLEVDLEVVTEAIDYLVGKGLAEGLEKFMHEVEECL